jgi:hypothetical protein
MREDKKEELLSFFVIALALIACSTLVYMLRTPSLTGNVVLETGSTTTIAIILILIVAGIMILIGSLMTIHRLQKEMEQHKKAIVEKSVLGESPDFDIAKYVVAAKEKGFTPEQITQRLTKMGWKPKEIAKYL